MKFRLPVFPFALFFSAASARAGVTLNLGGSDKF